MIIEFINFVAALMIAAGLLIAILGIILLVILAVAGVACLFLFIRLPFGLFLAVIWLFILTKAFPVADIYMQILINYRIPFELF